MRNENAVSFGENTKRNEIEDMIVNFKQLPETYMFYRHIFELVIIALVSPLLIILFALIAVIVLIDSKGKIIFRQIRVGKNAIPFTLFKFRTMHNISREDNDYYISPDGKVSKIGLFLRKHHLDELPQIWNIIKGDMSLIGPRPEIFQQYELFSQIIPNYKLRKMIPQGISGWAQVNYPNTITVEGNKIKLDYDLNYLYNISLVFDFKILFHTIIIMFNCINSKKI